MTLFARQTDLPQPVDRRQVGQPHPSGPVAATSAKAAPAGDELTALLIAVAADEPQAFARLYTRTSRHVYGLALRVLRCPEHAADVTQEVYLQVWQQAARYDPTRGAVLPWLLTLTHRRAVDRVRRLAVRRRGQEQTPDPAPAGDVVVETVLARADAEDVRRAVSGLSLVQQEALTMVYTEGRTAAQTAAVLNAPLGTVKTRIRDGLTNLRVALGVVRRS